MTNCTQTAFDFPALKRRKVQAEFSGGDITSDGGVLLLREIDRRLGLLEAVDAVIPDPRDPRYIEHSQLSLLRQRVYGLCLGYEDLNDHQTLRTDPALQSSIEREEVLGSQSTLCRLENRVDRRVAVDVHNLLLEQFIASYDAPPDELILDFDATDDPVHGRQEGRFFHGYYDHYCFLPLYVFCGDQLLVSYLRPSRIDAPKHAWAILALLVKRLRRAWPEVRIIFRGDSGFCRHHMLNQGAATGAVRRSHQRALLVGQSVSSTAVQSGLCADGGHPAPRAEGHGTGACTDDHDPAQTVQDRGGHHSQHATDPLPALQHLSLSGAVFPGGGTTQAGIARQSAAPAR